MSVTLKQLEILNSVVVTGSISNAARWTRLSQPTISQTLAKMEEVLGTQLIHRNRGSQLKLTPAGEYWFRSSCEILRQMEEIGIFHDSHFRDDSMILRFGALPTMRGRYIGIAARLAVEQPRFSRFEFVWGASSDEVVKQMLMHQINCGIIAEVTAQKHSDSLHGVTLFRDPIVWAVPKDVPLEVIEETLATQQAPAGYEALTRFVEVEGTPWHGWTGGWYRQNLPFARPYFGFRAHLGAVDLVAEGMATCHTPQLIVPSLPPSLREQLQFFTLDGYNRASAFVMPKHLLSVRPFAEFQQKFCELTRQDYEEEIATGLVQTLPASAAYVAADGTAA